MSMFKLDNSVQKYHWGDKSSIPNLLNISNNLNESFAELWMGVHHRGVSKILQTGQQLDTWLYNDKINRLGVKLSNRFNGLSYLLKVLAVESPLSIQVHPSIPIAENGFDKENKLSIPIDDPKRTFKDKNHKPEMVVAITSFWVMKGFRAVDKIRDNFNILDYEPLNKIIYQNNSDEQILKELLAFILQLDKKRKNELLQIIKRIINDEQLNDEWEWIKTLQSFYPDDISIISPLYLNLIKLEPGEALYLQDQEIHAYLNGVSVEIMANSDNVIRGGLTQKYINIDQLISVTNFQSSIVEIIKPDNNSIFRYPAEIEDFSLRRVLHLSSIETEVENFSVSIIVIMEGKFIIESNGDKLNLTKGESVVISNETRKYKLNGEGLAFIAESGF